MKWEVWKKFVVENVIFENLISEFNFQVISSSVGWNDKIVKMKFEIDK